MIFYKQFNMKNLAAPRLHYAENDCLVKLDNIWVNGIWKPSIIQINLVLSYKI